MRKSVIFFTAIIIVYMLFNYLNIRYAIEINHPLYKDGVGKLFIKAGNDKVIRIIENEIVDGNIEKVNLPLETIHVESFKHADMNPSRPVLLYEDKDYLYTIHDGEEKLIIREKKVVRRIQD